MQLAYQHIPPEYNCTFITPCINYLKSFTSVRKQHLTYDNDTRHKKLLPKLPIYSYELMNAPFLHGPLTSYQYESTFLQTQLRTEINFFERKWNQIFPFFQQLKETILNYIIQHNNHLYYAAAFNLHSLTSSIMYKNKILRQKKTRLRDQIIQLMQYLGLILDHTLFTLRQQVQRIYALKLMKKNIQFLLDHPHLQANVIYRHTFGNDFFSSTPMALIWIPAPSHLTIISSHSLKFKTNSPFLVPPQTHTSPKQGELETLTITQFDNLQQQQTLPSSQSTSSQITSSQTISSRVTLNRSVNHQNTQSTILTKTPKHPITQSPWRFRIKNFEYHELVPFQPNTQTISKPQKIFNFKLAKKHVIGKRLLERIFPDLSQSSYFST